MSFVLQVISESAFHILIQATKTLGHQFKTYISFEHFSFTNDNSLLLIRGKNLIADQVW